MMKSLCLTLGCAAVALPAWAETPQPYDVDADSVFSSAPTLTLQGASKTSKKNNSAKKSSNAAKAAAKKSKAKAFASVVDNLLEKGAFGLKAGLGAAWLSTDLDNNDWGSKFGFQLGAAYDASLFGPLGYRIEGSYSRKGSSLSGDAKNMFQQTDELDVTMNMVEVPIMLTVRFQVIPRVTVYGGLGAYLAYNVSSIVEKDSKVQKKYTYTNSKGDEKVKKYDDVWKWFDYGMNFALGAWFPLTKSMMASAEFRFVYGFADLDDHDESKTDEDYPLSNRNFLFLVGIHF